MMIDFFFFIGSTYTYLSVMRIQEIVARTGIAIRWRPFDVRSIMVEQNNIPFRGKPVKMRYMWRDLERRAHTHGIPWRSEPPYPLEHHAIANRVAVLADLEGWGPAYVTATYRDWFLEGRAPGETSHLTALLLALDRDPAATLARANSNDIVGRYDQNTLAARELGIFGSPSFAIGDEIFWGDDRLEDAVAWLVSKSKH